MLLLASFVLVFATTLGPSAAQRITTIQLDGVQYFISRMNPYSPELNYFLAYQYCRSLGLQLASFETKEKADSITTYLTNAGYNKYDFWTSGNNLGTDMYLWMSTGLPFNATFNYMRRVTMDQPNHHDDDSMDPLDMPQGSTAPQRTARHGKPLSMTTTTTAHPLTSSSPPPPRSEHLPTHFTLNDLIGKLRPSSLDGLQSPHLKTGALLKSPPQIDSHYSRASDAHSKEAKDPEQKEESTQGPYEADEGMVGDDPAAYLTHEARDLSLDDMPSTVEPDATEHSVHASGMLAPPAY